MERLFSPWRSKYIETFSKPKKGRPKCILCKAYRQDDDDERLIVTRAKVCYVMMNLYPYNSGHVMIVPYRHIGDVARLSDKEALEAMTLIKKMTRALRKVLQPDGFNIGFNIGRTAGAGIDKHLHFHVVPRWNGDTNFMPILADTKMISEDMRETLIKLRKVL